MEPTIKMQIRSIPGFVVQYAYLDPGHMWVGARSPCACAFACVPGEEHPCWGISRPRAPSSHCASFLECSSADEASPITVCATDPTNAYMLQ